MTRLIHTLIEELIGAEHFESAAEAVLRAMLAHVERALLGGPYARRGRILRGMVHLRPEGGYRGLVVLDQGELHVTSVPQDDSMLPSLTVWRWVESGRLPVTVDVQLAVVTPLGGEPVVLKDGLQGARDKEAAFASQARLLDREATHLCAIPLRLSATQVAGMISLEASCPSAMGQPFLFAEHAADLQLLADLAAPSLLSRPPRPVVGLARARDELLPVVGPSMEGLVSMLQGFARLEETLLITGPTGSGKSRLARWCHEQSRRRKGPFETVNLSTAPNEDLQKGELFGYVKGAFSGAVSDHIGCVGRAEGGTLFLDEIDKLSMKTQGALLQLLEERRYRRLMDKGGSRQADVRFIVGTNVDLRTAVKDGRFLQDLYYRIDVVRVPVPPLCDRRDEIVPWADYMLERCHRASRLGGTARFGTDAALALGAYSWPGNLRELDNVIRRAYAKAQGEWESADPQASIEIQLRHVEWALGRDRTDPQASLSEALRQAARTYAIEAERRSARGTPLSLNLAKAFEGFVLSAAVTLTGSRKDAFRIYGLSHMVESRNHYKAFKNALTEVVSALDEAGERPDAEILAQLKRKD